MHGIKSWRVRMRPLRIERLNHGIGFNTAAIELLLPTYGERLGLKGTVDALKEIHVDATRFGATRVVYVNVEVASHTYLMAKAEAPFREALSCLPMAVGPRAGTRLFSGIDASPVFSSARGPDKLVLQLSGTIEWAACLEACVEAGATAFLELGPGRALAAMAAAAYSAIPARSIDDFNSTSGLGAWLTRVT